MSKPDRPVVANPAAAKKAERLLILLPLKGLHLVDDGPIEDLFEQSWSVIGHAQMNQLECGGFGASLASNVRRMREHAWPTAFFLYRYIYPHVQISEAATKAEFSLSALTMAVLLKRWDLREDDGQPVANPRSVFRARYREYYDHPISLGRSGIKQVGGGKSVFSLLRPDSVAPYRTFSVVELREQVLISPPIVANVLKQERLSKRDLRLANGMAGIGAAFQTLSTGAFIASLASATEILLDSQAGSQSHAGAVPWARRIERLEVLVGAEHESVLKQIFQARHKFVHAAEQPTNDLLPFAALAMAVQAWTVVEELYRTYPNAQDVEALLDAVIAANRASHDGPEQLRLLREMVPLGASAKLPWINYWLNRAGE